MIGLFIIIYILFFLINKLIFKKTINYVNVIITLWFISSVLTIINPYDMYLPPTKMYKYILQFLVLFEFLSILFYKVEYSIKTNKNTTVNWNFINLSILFCVIILLPFSIKGFAIFISGGSFSTIRNAYLGYKICTNKTYLLLTLFIIPIGEAVGYYSIIDCLDKKKIKFSLIMFIIFMIEIIFFTGGRARIVYYTILLCIIILEKSKKLFSIIKQNKKILFALSILIVFIVVITSQRNLQGKGFIYNAYVYLVGGMQLFGIYLNNPTYFLLDGTSYLNGSVLFNSILYPFTSLLGLFNIKIKTGYYVVNEVTSQFLPISDITLINNGGTFIYYALRDFGSIGIFIYTFIITVLLSNFYKKKEKEYILYNRAMYYFFLIKCLFLITEFTLANTGVLMTFIYFKLFIKKGEE